MRPGPRCWRTCWGGHRGPHRLQFELPSLETFATRAQARAKVVAWIDDYNRRRRHSALGMMSPVDYEHANAAGEVA
jgi:transposase InsO family protein